MAVFKKSSRQGGAARAGAKVQSSGSSAPARSVAAQMAGGIRPGHHFEHIQINDDARAHLGDTYNISQFRINTKKRITRD